MNGLRGARVVNTRASRQAGPLDAALRLRGAEPISFPCIEIVAPRNPEPMRDAVRRLRNGEYDWLVFTSANAVEAVAAAMPRPIPVGVKFAAIGEGTTTAIRELLGREPSVVPDERRDAIGLIEAISAASGDRVLIPSSDIARSTLANGLRAAGARVEVAAAYRTVVGHGGADLGRLVTDGVVDAITFASPSAVDGFRARIAAVPLDFSLVASLPAACIGDVTAERAVELGFSSVAVAHQPTVNGLVEALESALVRTREGAVSCL